MPAIIVYVWAKRWPDTGRCYAASITAFPTIEEANVWCAEYMRTRPYACVALGYGVV